MVLVITREMSTRNKQPSFLFLRRKKLIGHNKQPIVKETTSNQRRDDLYGGWWPSHSSLIFNENDPIAVDIIRGHRQIPITDGHTIAHRVITKNCKRTKDQNIFESMVLRRGDGHDDGDDDDDGHSFR